MRAELAARLRRIPSDVRSHMREVVAQESLDLIAVGQGLAGALYTVGRDRGRVVVGWFARGRRRRRSTIRRLQPPLGLGHELEQRCRESAPLRMSTGLSGCMRGCIEMNAQVGTQDPDLYGARISGYELSEHLSDLGDLELRLDDARSLRVPVAVVALRRFDERLLPRTVRRPAAAMELGLDQCLPAWDARALNVEVVRSVAA